jgi:hypothetical protein
MSSTILIKLIEDYNNLLSKVSLEDKVNVIKELNIIVVATSGVDINGNFNSSDIRSYLLLDKEGNSLEINKE